MFAPISTPLYLHKINVHFWSSYPSIIYLLIYIFLKFVKNMLKNLRKSSLSTHLIHRHASKLVLTCPELGQEISASKPFIMFSQTSDNMCNMNAIMIAHQATSYCMRCCEHCLWQEVCCTPIYISFVMVLWLYRVCYKSLLSDMSIPRDFLLAILMPRETE